MASFNCHMPVQAGRGGGGGGGRGGGRGGSSGYHYFLIISTCF